MTEAFVRNARQASRSWSGRWRASGYAAVWATENTREAIFDAMKRRETYATTGSAHGRALLRRLRLRARGRRQPPAGGHRLRQGRADGRRPRCRAERQVADVPRGRAEATRSAANLDRVQVIKGWTSCEGQDCRRRSTTSRGATPRSGSPERTASCHRSASTVDVANATYTNTIGAPELIAVWKDPEFDRAPARVLLRPRDRDPDAALDRLRRQALRRAAASRYVDDAAGARLHLADLVFAGKS